jgi:tetratricopeptide (TPR) repeat protein
LQATGVVNSTQPALGDPGAGRPDDVTMGEVTMRSIRTNRRFPAHRMPRVRRPGTAGRALPLALGLLAVWAGTGCTGGASSTPLGVAEEPSPRLFTEVTREAGIDHRHLKPALDPKLDNIMAWVSSIGAAVAAGDYDNDGDVDLYLTTSRKGRPNRLYRNDGDGSFTEVGGPAGLADVNGDRGVSMDCVWGDYDNDGWIDLYLVRWGRDSLFHNDGNGTFTEVTDQLFRRPDGARGTAWKNGAAALFLDYDLDGRLDLYVGNYFADHDLWNLETTRIMHDDFENSRNAGRNELFHQLPDGTFEDVAAALGVNDPGWTLAVGSGDVDNDGRPDLYTADDFGPDQLFLNDGEGGFTDVSEAALGFDTKKGMNVDFGDFDADGWIDVYVTNITTAEYLQEGNMLWRNNGITEDGTPSFTDVSLEAGTYDGGWGWGAKFFDFDNDGDLDIVAVNGFITAGEGNYWYDLASWTVTGEDSTDARNWPAIGDRSFSGSESTRLWRNEGLGSFTERAVELGVDTRYDGRGIAYVDYDDDGDLDLVIANQDQPAQLLRNERSEAEPRAHWLEVRLIADPATGTNRDAVGARVTAVTPDGLLVRERDGGNGYAAQSDPRLHFGLGALDRVELLEVRWPDGGYQYLENVAADREIRVRQNPADYVEGVRIPVAAPAPPSAPVLTANKETAVEPSAEELAAFEERLLRGEGGYALASAYRRRCARAGLYDRAIEHFTEATEGPEPPTAARIQLASAYVDKIPSCGGLAAVVCKGSLAKKALDQLDAVLAEDPDSWIALYSRGINHLHWPRALRHSDDAAADLERCVQLQHTRYASRRDEIFLRVHVALGDAYVKAGDYGPARRAWRRGLEEFAEAPELTARLALDDDELLPYVERQRSLEQPIDTDLGFFDRLR